MELSEIEEEKSKISETFNQGSHNYSREKLDSQNIQYDWDRSNFSSKTSFAQNENFLKFKDLLNTDNNDSINFLKSEQTINFNNMSLMKILSSQNNQGCQFEKFNEDVQKETSLVNVPSDFKNEGNLSNFPNSLFVRKTNNFELNQTNDVLNKAENNLSLNSEILIIVNNIITNLINKVDQVILNKNPIQFENFAPQNNSNISNSHNSKQQTLAPKISDFLNIPNDDKHHTSSNPQEQKKHDNPFGSDYSMSQSGSRALSFIPQCENQSDHVYYLSNATFNLQQNSDAGLLKTTLGKFNPDSIFRINDRIDNSFVPESNSKKQSLRRNQNVSFKNGTSNYGNYLNGSDGQNFNCDPSIFIGNENFTFLISSDKNEEKSNDNKTKFVISKNKNGDQKKSKGPKLNSLEEIENNSEEDKQEEIEDKNLVLKNNPFTNQFSKNYSDKFNSNDPSTDKIPMPNKKENQSAMETNIKSQTNFESRHLNESFPPEEEKDIFIEEIDKQLRISNMKILQRTTKILDEKFTSPKVNLGEQDENFQDLLKPKLLNSYQDSYRLSLECKESKTKESKNDAFGQVIGENDEKQNLLNQFVPFNTSKELQEKVSRIEESQRNRINELLAETLPKIIKTPHLTNTQTSAINENQVKSKIDIDVVQTKNELGTAYSINNDQNINANPKVNLNTENSSSELLSNVKLFSSQSETLNSNISHSKQTESNPTNSSSCKLKDSNQEYKAANSKINQQSEEQKPVIRLFKRNQPSFQKIRQNEDLIIPKNELAQNSAPLGVSNSKKFNIIHKNFNEEGNFQNLTQQSKISPILDTNKNNSYLRNKSLNLQKKNLKPHNSINLDQKLKSQVSLFKRNTSVSVNLEKSKSSFIYGKDLNKNFNINLLGKKIGQKITSQNLKLQPNSQNYKSPIKHASSNFKQTTFENPQQILINNSPIPFHPKLIPISNLKTLLNPNCNPKSQNSQKNNNNAIDAKRSTFINNSSTIGKGTIPNSSDIRVYSYKDLPSSYWVNHNSTITSLNDSQRSHDQISQNYPSLMFNLTSVQLNEFSKNVEKNKIDISLPKEDKKLERIVLKNRKEISNNLSKSPITQLKANNTKARNFSIDLTRLSQFSAYFSSNKINSQNVESSKENPSFYNNTSIKNNLDKEFGLHKHQIKTTENKTRESRSNIKLISKQVQNILPKNIDLDSKNVSNLNFQNQKLTARTKLMFQGKEAVLFKVEKDGKEYYRFP